MREFPAVGDSIARPIPWVQEIPDGWEWSRLKTVLRERNARNHAHEPLLAATQSMGVVRKETYGQRTVLVQTGFEQLKLVEPRDFVISLRSFQGGIEYARERGIISAAYTVLRTSDPDLQPYLGYLLKSRVCLDAIQNCVVGIREGQNVDWKRLGRELVPVPPAADQGLIVRYLDNAELRIARAIQAKRATAALLREERSAVVIAVMTVRDGGRPAFPGAPFMVPSDWVNKPFWAVARETRRTGGADLELLSVFLQHGVIKYGEGGGQVHKPSLDLSSYQEVRPGNLVLNNQQAWRGSLGVSAYHGIISPAYVICALSPDLDATWANSLFRSRIMVDQFVFASRGVGSIQRQLHSASLRKLRVSIPPLAEQQRMAVAIQSATAHIDDALASLDQEIALLREYRTRLISDVVTGKKDVRAEAAGMKDVDPAELAAVLGGATDSGNDDIEGDDDVE